MSRYCFITGFLRSGTTLVEKLVHALPGACIGPQPFPFLYHDAKRAFLGARDIPDERYPLGHLFGEDRYRPEDFTSFLRGHRLTREAVAACFTRMQGYSGWKLPAIAGHAQHVGEGSFADVYRGLCDALPGVFGREAGRLLGAKEVFCEEFIPHFLEHDIAVILVVRDIRDVLTSLKFGGGTRYVNPELQLLHIVRQWRKSVAFALQFAGAAGFEWLRYEALVAAPRAWLDGLAGRLGCLPAPAAAVEDLRGQDGRSWQGNSSFAPVHGVSTGSVGRFAGTLPAAWLAAAEALCAPEMAVLGLAPAGRGQLAPALEAVQVGAGEAEVEEERARLIAAGKASEDQQRRWCIFPRAYRALAASGKAAL